MAVTLHKISAWQWISFCNLRPTGMISSGDWVFVSLPWYCIYLQWEDPVLPSPSSKKVWEIQILATLLLPKASSVVKSVFMNMFKQKKLSLVQSETHASLPNGKHREPFAHCIVCLWEIAWFTAFFVNIILSIQGESMCSGSIGSTFCTFCFVPYRLKENVEFAYESMGLLRFKKEPQNNHVSI